MSEGIKLNKMINDRLSTWFGLSYASFLTLPRVLMQEMPYDWQEKMAELLEEYDNTFDTSDIGINDVCVVARDENKKYTKMPVDLINYRRPNFDFVNLCKVSVVEEETTE